MVLTYSEQLTLGSPAHKFQLSNANLSVDGAYPKLTLDEVAGERGTLIVFICNHCPYVRRLIDKLVSTADELVGHGINTVAICSNDAVQYPDDSFENMTNFARENRFSFPYLWDQTQKTAREYGAVCTPDFFGYDADLRLRYRGRLDDDGGSGEPKRELFEAMKQIAQSGEVTSEQSPSIGCSIKWK